MAEISIIIPVYNGECYIDKIANDLTKQKMTDFEAIFIDDGSVDDSHDKIQDIIDSRSCSFDIKLIRQENKGVSAARNAGISCASGKYICFVDVDDSITPGYLSEMYCVIQKENADAIFCKIARDKPGKNNTAEYSVLNKNEALELFLFNNSLIGIWSMMVSSSIIKDNNLLFAEGYKYSEDDHMVWRILAYCEKIVMTEKELYVYNKNQGSAMTKFNENRLDSIGLIRSLEGFFSENNKEFSVLFEKYGAAHEQWSVLWQAAYHLSWKEFRRLTAQHDFKQGLMKMLTYPAVYVKVSSRVFLLSGFLFFIGIKMLTPIRIFG